MSDIGEMLANPQQIWHLLAGCVKSGNGGISGKHVYQRPKRAETDPYKDL